MSKKVLVTGASGFLASQIVAHLVSKGKYEVRGTVRSLEKSKHLQKLFPQMKLYQADLLTEGSFDQAVKDVEIVFHTASPFQIANIKDPKKELIEPALQGTLNVLRSVDKTPSVRRVVLTSSVAASARGKPPSHVYSEKDWNRDSTETKEPYPYSKTVAEESAWKFAEGKNWKLSTILPSFILGAPLSDRIDAVSVGAIKNLLEGKHHEKDSGWAVGAVSIHDVAEAHILAAEKKEAIGQRYFVTSTKSFSRQDLNQILIQSGEFKNYPLDKNTFVPPKGGFNYSNSKVQKDLGLKITPVDQTVVEMGKALVKLNIVKLTGKL